LQKNRKNKAVSALTFSIFWEFVIMLDRTRTREYHHSLLFFNAVIVVSALLQFVDPYFLVEKKNKKD